MKKTKSLSFLLATIVAFGSLVPFLPAAPDSAEDKDSAAGEPSRALTLRPVKIDPLGADPDTPWFVHLNSLTVRDTPATGGSGTLGRAVKGEPVTGIYLLVEESDEEWLQFEFEGRLGYISRIGFSRIHPHNQELIDAHGNLPFGKEIVNRWWGIPLEYEADDLVEVPAEYTRQVKGRSYRLRREAAESLMKMMDAMRAEGLEIYISSPYRAGSTQQSIYRGRMNRSLNQRRSAPPGHSEHQLGTTVDLARARSGGSLRNTDPQHAWLEANGAKYGWRQTYRGENIAETGYIEEPWHWRYLGKAALGEQ